MNDIITYYKYMIATDRDGTIDTIDKTSKDDKPVIDPSINMILSLAKANNCMSVLMSGRTINDNLQDLKNHSIGKFDYIVGDNGGTIYNTKTSEMIKFILGENIVDTIFDIVTNVNTTYNNFPENKSNEDIMPIDNIRFTNGENIFTYNNQNNHEYYKKKSVKYFNSITDLKNITDITKITLSGPKTLMEIFATEMSNLNLKTHLVKSKFPKKSSDNYILDITSSQSTKGNALKYLAEKHRIEKYFSFGNDWNDESMLLETILSGNNAYVVSRNAPHDFLIFLHNKIKDFKKAGIKNLGKLSFIPDTNPNSLNEMKEVLRDQMIPDTHSSKLISNLRDKYEVSLPYTNKQHREPFTDTTYKKSILKLPKTENKGHR